MKTTLLLLTFTFISTFCFNQKELISKWEKDYGEKYTLEVFYEKGAENPLTAVMKQSNSPSNHIIRIADNGYFQFYNPYTFRKEMIAEIKIVDGEHRLYFNSGSLYLVRTFPEEKELEKLKGVYTHISQVDFSKTEITIKNDSIAILKNKDDSVNIEYKIKKVETKICFENNQNSFCAKHYIQEETKEVLILALKLENGLIFLQIIDK